MELLLNKIILVFLCHGELPIHLGEHVANCIELVLLDVLALWEQHWKLDSTTANLKLLFQKTRSYKFLKF